MNKKRKLALGLAWICLASVTSLNAQNTPPTLIPDMQFRMFLAENNLFEGRFLLRVKDDINLKAEQQKAIENMMLAHEESAITREADIKVREMKLAVLLKQNRINRKEMEKMARDISGRKTDLLVDHLNYLLDLRDILSSEQISKLDDLKKKFGHEFRDRWQRGPGHPENPPRGDHPANEPEDGSL